VWDRELHREADWRALGGWRPRHVERGAVRARGGRRWRSSSADSSAKVALGESTTGIPLIPVGQINSRRPVKKPTGIK
jgi:hypothetical protein